MENNFCVAFSPSVACQIKSYGFVFCDRRSVEGVEQKQTACYDIDVEVDDTLKTQMNSFLLSTASQVEIQSLDNKIHETVETINQLKTNREFFLSFAKDPQQFINKWIISQTRDLKVCRAKFITLKCNTISIDQNQCRILYSS